MNELIDLPWRTIPASFLIAGGIALAVRSAARGLSGPHLRLPDPPRALGILRGFRRAIVGICMAGVGAAWLWQMGWLLALSLIIGGEELLESSVHIAALRHGTGSSRKPGTTVYSGALPPIS